MFDLIAFLIAYVVIVTGFILFCWVCVNKF